MLSPLSDFNPLCLLLSRRLSKDRDFCRCKDRRLVVEIPELMLQRLPLLLLLKPLMLELLFVIMTARVLFRSLCLRIEEDEQILLMLLLLLL